MGEELLRRGWDCAGVGVRRDEVSGSSVSAGAPPAHGVRESVIDIDASNSLLTGTIGAGTGAGMDSDSDSDEEAELVRPVARRPHGTVVKVAMQSHAWASDEISDEDVAEAERARADMSLEEYDTYAARFCKAMAEEQFNDKSLTAVIKSFLLGGGDPNQLVNKVVGVRSIRMPLYLSLILQPSHENGGGTPIPVEHMFHPERFRLFRRFGAAFDAADEHGRNLLLWVAYLLKSRGPEAPNREWYEHDAAFYKALDTYWAELAAYEETVVAQVMKQVMDAGLNPNVPVPYRAGGMPIGQAVSVLARGCLVSVRSILRHASFNPMRPDTLAVPAYFKIIESNAPDAIYASWMEALFAIDDRPDGVSEAAVGDCFVDLEMYGLVQRSEAGERVASQASEHTIDFKYRVPPPYRTQTGCSEGRTCLHALIERGLDRAHSAKYAARMIERGADPSVLPADFLAKHFPAYAPVVETAAEVSSQGNAFKQCCASLVSLMVCRRRVHPIGVAAEGVSEVEHAPAVHAAVAGAGSGVFAQRHNSGYEAEGELPDGGVAPSTR